MENADKLFKLPAKYWHAPFHYDSNGSCINDANGHMIVDVRGWGYLTGRGSLALPEELAVQVQNQLGEGVAKLLSAAWPNPLC